MHAAVGARTGTMKIPNPNYLEAASFGSLELRKSERTEFIGQKVDYSEDKLVEVSAITLDSLKRFHVWRNRRRIPNTADL
jgi:hypothetical protein